MSDVPPPPPPSIPPPPPPYPTGAQPFMVRDHPKATTALILGILGLVVCGLIGPFALGVGRKAVREIDASNGMLGGRGQATAGWIMGLVSTILLAISVLVFVVFLIVAIASSDSSSSLGL